MRHSDEDRSFLMRNIGKIVQIIGAVVDIRFEKDHLPNLLNAIEIDNHGTKLTVEVAQHIGDDVVRCIAMSSTDGLVRGTDAIDTGEPIKVPVGRETLGRIFNVLGEPVDEKPEPNVKDRWPIHRDAPSYEEQTASSEILETGIKVIDLIAPYLKGGKIGLFGGAGSGCVTEVLLFNPEERYTDVKKGREYIEMCRNRLAQDGVDLTELEAAKDESGRYAIRIAAH